MENRIIKDINWPDKKKFAVGLSHDVDIVVHSPPRMGKGIRNFFGEVRDYRAEANLGNILGFAANRYLFNPYSNIVKWARLEEELGLRSTFFVMAKHLKHKFILKSLKKVHAEGWEVGLHADFNTCNNKNNFEL